jgi:cardiolipin synthase
MQLRPLASEPPEEGHAPRVLHVAGHELQLFVESPPLIDAMLADIRAARNRVWMETYIFADDAVGRAVAEALADRARAGLDVRLVIDAFGSFSLPNSRLQPMRDAGVQVHAFHSLGHILKAPRLVHALNQRNHRKLLVIDDQIAYFGGMNVVDLGGIHTRDDARRQGLPASAGWRDVHARLVGPRQVEISAMMDRLWQGSHHRKRQKSPRWPVPDFSRSAGEALYFFDSRPALRRRRPQRVLIPLIRQARREIMVLMAYFVPLGRVLRELAKARRRGVRVRVILPQSSDVKLVEWATRHFYERLLKRRIEVYERRDRMLHGKAMVVDGRYSVIGSCNLDARSLRFNLEFFAVIDSPEVAAELARIGGEEIAASRRVDAAYCRGRPFWQRSFERFAWSLRKWL